MNYRPRLRSVVTTLASLGATALLSLGTASGGQAAPTAPEDTATPRAAAVYHHIVARHSGRCLDVRGASTADGAAVIQYVCIANHANQEWDLTRNDAGYFRIRVRHSGKCLDVRGASRADGADIIQYSCHGGHNQQWRLVRDGAGYYQLRARHSGKCLDIEGASTMDGARAIQYRCHGGYNQQFRL